MSLNPSLTEINIDPIVEHCSVCAADRVVSSFQNSVCVSVCLSVTFSPPHPRALPEALAPPTSVCLYSPVQ